MPQTTQVLALVTLAVLTGSAHAQEARMVPVTVDGERVRLEMRVYEPAAGAPSPTLVFNHGSTGSGTNPESFTRPLDFPEVARFFVARGWAVVIPGRRGRGGSEGRYDEGFAPTRSWGYACDPVLSVAGADRALRDIQAAMDSILAMPFVDRSRVVIGGQSRGGILSVAYAGQHAEQVKGVINFVGGWNGARCQHAATINQSLFVRGARYPDETLWLYGDEDPFYPLSHSRGNFAAFQAAGGRGSFHELPPEFGGHYIWKRPDRWAPIVEGYLARRGLPSAVNQDPSPSQ
jgi:dienelactone hydrolase